MTDFFASLKNKVKKAAQHENSIIDNTAYMHVKMTPEELYQNNKKAWYFHESSWYMRDVQGDDGSGCGSEVVIKTNSDGNHCIPSCKYFGKEGKIIEEE